MLRISYIIDKYAFFSFAETKSLANSNSETATAYSRKDLSSYQ